MFKHDEAIPVEFAVAFWAVLHNRASAECWECLRNYHREQALEWAESILRMNRWEINRHLGWFKRELRNPGTEDTRKELLRTQQFPAS